MHRLLALANFGLLFMVLVMSTACASGTGYAPSTGSSSGAAPSSAAPAAPASEGSPAAPDALGQSAGDPAPMPAPGEPPLLAGQVDDNASFDDYLGYLRGYTSHDIHPVDVQRRLFVRVLDETRHPVAGARVRLLDGDRQVFDGSTVSDGRVLFFPNTAAAEQSQTFRAS
jgi:hypothetical protein